MLQGETARRGRRAVQGQFFGVCQSQVALAAAGG